MQEAATRSPTEQTFPCKCAGRIDWQPPSELSPELLQLRRYAVLYSTRTGNTLAGTVVWGLARRTNFCP